VSAPGAQSIAAGSDGCTTRLGKSQGSDFDRKADIKHLGTDYNRLVPFQFAPFGPAPGIEPAFVRYHPAPFLRPFMTAEDAGD
jgi:hypothetical protein